MSHSSLESLKIKAKLLQKAKKKNGEDFPLKEAFSMLATTAGYKNWKDLKDSYQYSDLLNPPRWSAQWKTWFSTREEAYLHFNEKSGYLLPYRKQFFICDQNYINALGISADDVDLKRVGRDWSIPQDKKAWERLLKKIGESHKKT